MNYSDLFSGKPLIACVHLLPLPGSPGYSGTMNEIYDMALKEAAIYVKYGCSGLLIENFRDIPFYPDRIPPETIASLANVTHEIVKNFNVPVGVNALRNDAVAALSIATAAGAHFIRVNILTGAAVTDQGIIEGRAFETLRLRANLRSGVLIFADVAVKHSQPLAGRSIDLEAADIEERGMADAVIVTGDRTGSEASIRNLKLVKQNVSLPVLIGSGLNPDNIGKFYQDIDGMIVGSYFKTKGKVNNFVEEARVKLFTEKLSLMNP